MTGLGFGTLPMPVENYRPANLHERIFGSLHGIPSPLLYASAGVVSRISGVPNVLCDRVAARPNNILQILTFVNVFEYFPHK